MSLAPIALFAYNRPHHVARTVEALLQNPLAGQSELFIFSDGPKTDKDVEKVREVREYLYTIKGFKRIEITEREKNWGLAQSIITGVSTVLNNYDRIIVMEDDILSLPSFLNFINDALAFYEEDEKIFSISGFNYPIPVPASYPHSVYISPRASSLGWATWRDRWAKADWEVKDYEGFKRDKAAQKAFNRGGPNLTSMLVKQQKGMINSWAIRWCYTHYKQKGYCLFPVNSKIQHIGADGSGSETPKTKKLDVVFEEAPYEFTPDLQENEGIMEGYQKYFKQSFIRRIINFFMIRF